MRQPGTLVGDLERSLFVLHRIGFTLPPRLPLERWALTPPFHPYLRPCGGGGLFSVALSVTTCVVPRLAAGILPGDVRTFLTDCSVRMRVYDCPSRLGQKGGEGKESGGGNRD